MFHFNYCWEQTCQLPIHLQSWLMLDLSFLVPEHNLHHWASLTGMRAALRHVVVSSVLYNWKDIFRKNEFLLYRTTCHVCSLSGLCKGFLSAVPSRGCSSFACLHSWFSGKGGLPHFCLFFLFFKGRKGLKGHFLAWKPKLFNAHIKNNYYIILEKSIAVLQFIQKTCWYPTMWNICK